jgi:predicted alpha/beta superfamily hydrolase
MRPRFVFVTTLIICLLGGTSFAADAPAFPPHTIGNSQLRVLPRNADGREYQLHIGLPASYAKDKDRRYPVFFVTDGYWDFEKMHVIRGSLVYDKVVPEFIIVGLGYPGENLDYGRMRRWELSPVQFDGDPRTGRAGNFLRALETEIIPFVEREYRIDPENRILAGASLGGLFTLYAMYSKPQLFSGYVAATPAVVVGNDWLIDYEESFVAENRALSTRLFVSVGENESPAFRRAIMRYHERVSSRKHEGLAYQFRVIDGERHAGMQSESYTRGLRFVFKPLAPETGPSR